MKHNREMTMINSIGYDIDNKGKLVKTETNTKDMKLHDRVKGIY